MLKNSNLSVSKPMLNNKQKYSKDSHIKNTIYRQHVYQQKIDLTIKQTSKLKLRLKSNQNHSQKIIKIEVNKLLKQKQNRIENCNLPIKKYNINSQNDHEKINQKHKTFQQMYYEKIKQLQNVDSFDKKLINLKSYPLSCKNSNFIPNKSPKVHPSSTKNLVRYIQTQFRDSLEKPGKANQIIIQKPFFQKKSRKMDHFQQINKPQQKPKKIALSKKTDIKQKIRQDKQNIDEQSLFGYYFEQKLVMEINHAGHQHIWGEKECFFEYKQFQMIMNRLLSMVVNIKNWSQEYNKQLIIKLWKDLGGIKFGGVVKANIIKFMDVVLYDDKDGFDRDDFTPIVTQFDEQSIEFYDFIHESTLKLTKLSKRQILYVQKQYFLLKLHLLAKLADFQNTKALPPTISTILVNNEQDFRSIEAKLSTTINKQHNKSQILINEAYLDNSNESHEHEGIHVSPSSLVKKQKLHDNDNFVNDFSPKLSTQQYQPFKSTILHRQKQQSNQSNSSNHSSSNFQTEKQSSDSIILKPLLSVDVNLGQGQFQKLIVYEGQTPYEVSMKLKQKYNIEQDLRIKFQKMLNSHMRNLLFKIQQQGQDEEQIQQKASNISQKVIF